MWCKEHIRFRLAEVHKAFVNSIIHNQEQIIAIHVKIQTTTISLSSIVLKEAILNMQ